MVRSRRAGFTLVELLVVITIIGMLMSLLLPAVNQAREAGRRIDCDSRTRQICLASIMYNSQKNYFPGYIESSNGTPNGNYKSSWAIMMAPLLEKQDIWTNWLTGGTTSNAAGVYWDQLVCPSNPPAATIGPVLSYVVNAGRPDSGSPPDKLPNGMSFDLYTTTGANQVKISAEYLEAGKGASYTIYSSENTLPGLSWVIGGSITGTLAATSAETQCAFNWQAYATTSAAPQPAHTAAIINGDKANAGTTATAPSVAADYARPASNHPGGVNAGFCDGHTRFIQQSINYYVYQYLMTSYPSKSDASAYFTGAVSGGYVLSDSDVQ